MDCTIKRVKDKTSNFTVVYNELFQRSDVSARAKGIYAYIMTLPDNWKIYKSELYEHFSEGRDSIDKAFKELEKLGYITKERAKNKDGKFDGWNYEIFESLDDTDSLKNRKSEMPKSVNPQLLSTDSSPSTENVYIPVLEKWNSLGIINHDSLVVKSKWQKKHTEQVKLYGQDKVFKAMENYATIIHSSSYFFDYKWPLWDFIARGLYKFLDEASPLENFKAKKIESKTSNDPYKGIIL